MRRRVRVPVICHDSASEVLAAVVIQPCDRSHRRRRARVPTSLNAGAVDNLGHPHSRAVPSPPAFAPARTDPDVPGRLTTGWCHDVRDESVLGDTFD